MITLAGIESRACCVLLALASGCRLNPQSEARAAPDHQPALIALGRDPESGLEEVLVAGTGEAPRRDERGRCVIAAETGIVLVAIPSPTQPFLLGKYEITQAQWSRITGANPSTYAVGEHMEFEGRRETVDARHPVETVACADAAASLRKLGLRLPTPAEWEFACREGQSSHWLDLPDLRAEMFARVGNLCDWSMSGPAALRISRVGRAYGLDDGRGLHAPVGRFEANLFGLHDLIGNVAEICALPEKGRWFERGSAFTTGIEESRPASGGELWPGSLSFDRGVRAACDPH